MELFSGCMIIFAARVTDMSLEAIRTILAVRGKSIYAALVGFIEALLYIVILLQVINNFHNWESIFAYAAGFAAGTLLGALVEEKLASGFSTVQIVSMACPLAIAQKLRTEGFGVTVMQGQGREGDRFILMIHLRRKDLPSLIEMVEKLDPSAFMTVNDTRTLRGGFGITRKNK